MLKSIQLVNFKSYKNITIDLGKLNLFIGKNNSGKSNLLQSIIFLQNIINNFNHGLESIGGFNAIRYCTSQETSEFSIINVQFYINQEKEKGIKLLLIIFPNYQFISNFQLIDESNKNFIGVFQIKLNNITSEINEVIEKIFDDYFNKIYDVNEINLIRQNLSRKNIPITQIFSIPLVSSRGASLGNGILDWNFFFNISDPNGSVLELLNNSKTLVKKDLENLQLILEPRYILNSKFKLTNQLPKFNDYKNSPDKGDVLSNFLIYNKASEIQAYPIDEFNKWIEMFEIKRVNASILPQYQINIQVVENDFERAINQLGAGTRSVISVVIGCIFSEENCILLIEEPEIGLHPEFQALMMDFIIEQMKNGKQILVTTHSEHMLTRIQRRIAEKQINNKDVGIFWVLKDKYISTTEKVTITKDGIFPDGLKTYLDFITNELTSILDARGEKGNY